MEEYLSIEEKQQLQNAQTFKEIGQIATKAIKKMPNNLAQVCGPITTGGTTIQENQEKLTKTINKLIQQGKKIYDQRPLENAIFKVREQLAKNYNPQELLEQIFKPLFETGKITTTYFIEGWKTSTGAKWEHEQAKKRNIKIIYLEKNFEKN